VISIWEGCSYLPLSPVMTIHDIYDHKRNQGISGHKRIVYLKIPPSATIEFDDARLSPMMYMLMSSIQIV
jgi:hypothetical protein